MEYAVNQWYIILIVEIGFRFHSKYIELTGILYNFAACKKSMTCQRTKILTLKGENLHVIFLIVHIKSPECLVRSAPVLYLSESPACIFPIVARSSWAVRSINGMIADPLIYNICVSIDFMQIRSCRPSGGLVNLWLLLVVRGTTFSPQIICPIGVNVCWLLILFHELYNNLQKLTKKSSIAKK